MLRFQGGEGDRAERDIDEALGVFEGRDVPIVFIVHPTAGPPDLRERLARRGFALAEMLSGMVKVLDGEDVGRAPLPAGVSIVDGDVRHGVDWIGLTSWRYGMPEEHRAYLAGLYELEFAHGDRALVACRDGVALSKADLHLHDGVAGIYGVVTDDTGRRLGLATAVTIAALGHAREAGATAAILHATPAAVGLYERLGFATVAEFEVWAEPDRLFRSVAAGLRAERARKRRA